MSCRGNLIKSVEMLHVLLIDIGGGDVTAASEPPLCRQALVFFCLKISAQLSLLIVSSQLLKRIYSRYVMIISFLMLAL